VDLFFAGAANAGALKQKANTTARSLEQGGKNVIVSRDPIEKSTFLIRFCASDYILGTECSRPMMKDQACVRQLLYRLKPF